MPDPIKTNFTDENGADLGYQFVKKDYLIEQTNLFPYLGATLWMWGRDNFGALGDNQTLFDRSSPVQTIAGGPNWKCVATDGGFTAAIKCDGTLWTWGRNNIGGKLGDNTIINRSSPVQTIAGGTNWKSVDTSYFSALAIKCDGTVWGWGCNIAGVLGDYTSVRRSSPVQEMTGSTNWKQVSIATAVAGGIKNDGSLWMWGCATEGRLGNGSIIGTGSPVQTISGGNDWKQVAVGSWQTGAIKCDGTLWTWGANSYGQLGNNATAGMSSPVQTVAGGTNWKLVAASDCVLAGIKTDGTLWMWGYNYAGGVIPLGIRSFSQDRSSPVQTIAGGTNWKSVDLDRCLAGGLKTDGTLWMWGKNDSGELGDGTRINRESPVQTVAGGNNWKQVAVGYGAAGIKNEDL